MARVVIRSGQAQVTCVSVRSRVTPQHASFEQSSLSLPLAPSLSPSPSHSLVLSRSLTPSLSLSRICCRPKKRLTPHWSPHRARRRSSRRTWWRGPRSTPTMPTPARGTPSTWTPSCRRSVRNSPMGGSRPFSQTGQGKRDEISPCLF